MWKPESRSRVVAKILLVEDNELNRDMLSRRLVRSGHEVLIAVDGSEAVATAGALGPELILMDLRLPDMDGREVTRLLKADQATRHIPVIALTAHAMEGDRDEAIRAGCDDYDTKPVEMPRLLEKIRALLEKKSP
jgi:CheY-like chemotaxis protein